MESLPQIHSFDPELLAPLETRITDVNLDQFISEYFKLQKSLETSHESENRFLSKCKELSKKIAKLSTNLGAMSQCNEEDMKKKEQLKAMIENNNTIKDDMLRQIAEKKEQVLKHRTDLDRLGEQMHDSSSDAIQNKRNAIERLKLERSKYERNYKGLEDTMTHILKKYSDLVKQVRHAYTYSYTYTYTYTYTNLDNVCLFDRMLTHIQET
jgi:chromosome segregation ATPase